MRWPVFVCKDDLVVFFGFVFFLFILTFCLSIYIPEEHTRHVSMCFTVAGGGWV